MDTARFERLVAIRPGEGQLVARVALLFAVLEAARGFGEVGADAQLVARYGTEGLPGALPFLFIALGISGLVVSLAYAVGLARFARPRLFVAILVVAAALLVLERLALAAGMIVVIPIVWLTVQLASAINLTIGWTVAGASFDARQAKRLFPVLIGAAIVGSFVGTLLAGPVAGLLGVEELLTVQAVLLIAGAVVLDRLPRTRRRPPTTASASVVEGLRIGFDTVRASSLLRLVALAYVLLAVLSFSVSYPFYIAAADEFAGQPAVLATALGLLSAAVTGASFLLSLFVANRLYARFGVSAGALALPLVYLVGFGVWLLQFSFATAAAFRFSQQVTQRGVSNAAWSAFYNVVPVERRAQAMAFNDGVPGQFGTIVSGLLLLAAAALPGLTAVFLLGAVTAAIATVVALGIRRRYAASLMTALRSGLAEQVLEGGPGLPVMVERPDVRAVLLAALEAPEERTRRLAVELLGRSATLRPDDRARLAPLVDDPSPTVRGAVAVALAGDPSDERPTQIVMGLLRSSGGVDRVAGLEAAARVPERIPSSAIAPLLGDGSAVVRAAAIEAAAAHPEAEACASIAALIAALGDDATSVRAAASRALRERPGAGPALTRVLRTGSPRAQDAALAAMTSHVEAVREDLLHWAEERIARAETLHRARSSIDVDDSSTSIRGYLDVVLGQRARRNEDQAIAALVAVGAPTASGLMRRSLRSTDPEARAQAIEALDSLGDRRLGRALAACLEATGDGSRRDGATMLERLSHDEDPWIAMLSSRVLGASTQPTRAPTGAVVDGEEPMTRPDNAVTELDTMLLLRRVSLFADLEPEDLQRIAMVATERDYEAGEVLMGEGDVADEMFIIAEGAVRVVRRAADGAEEFIRTYEAGDHIGELAILREGPRAATVIAEEGGVRGFVLGGDGLRAILRERPDAAMAMLATLAERISRH